MVCSSHTIMRRSMKTHKFIFTSIPAISAIALTVVLSLTSMATAQEQPSKDTLFLQKIQDHLTNVSGIKDSKITVIVTTDSKRKIDLTSTSISLSYGFLKHLRTANQLVATLAHMTAHIALDYVAPPPLPDDIKNAKGKTSTGDYLKSAVRPKYPDEGNIPQATGSFHREGAQVLERPRYQNKDYDYAVNKDDIIKAEHELEVDKITDKIMRHAGFCPSDYSRMLRYFYENPQLILGNKHFALDADGWQRLDAVNHRANPTTICNAEQIAQTTQYAPAFDQFTVKIRQALRKKSD